MPNAISHPSYLDTHSLSYLAARTSPYPFTPPAVGDTSSDRVTVKANGAKYICFTNNVDMVAPKRTNAFSDRYFWPNQPKVHKRGNCIIKKIIM